MVLAEGSGVLLGLLGKSRGNIRNTFRMPPGATRGAGRGLQREPETRSTRCVILCRLELVGRRRWPHYVGERISQTYAGIESEWFRGYAFSTD